MPDTTRSVSGRAHVRAGAPHSNVDSRCCASGNSPLSIEELRAQSSGKLDADHARSAAVFLCELFATEIAAAYRLETLHRVNFHARSLRAVFFINQDCRVRENLRSEPRSGIVSSGFEDREKTTRFRSDTE